MLRLLKEDPNIQPETGWTHVETPLCAAAHAKVNDAAHELCEDWRALSSGRLSLVRRANFRHWFGPLMQAVPVGLSAELLMANDMLDEFTALLVADPQARAYILALPDHCFHLDKEEGERLAHAVDIARAIETRMAARAMALEACHD